MARGLGSRASGLREYSELQQLYGGKSLTGFKFLITSPDERKSHNVQCLLDSFDIRNPKPLNLEN